jgi:hypothetical protein
LHPLGGTVPRQLARVGCTRHVEQIAQLIDRLARRLEDTLGADVDAGSDEPEVIAVAAEAVRS